MSTLRLVSHSRAPIELDRDRALVGRDPSCDVVLDDKSVSRRHAVVERRGPSWHVVDQGSANGTFINGQQVVEAQLLDGQELRLGTVSLWVEMEGAAQHTMLMGGAPATALMPNPMGAPAAPRAAGEAAAAAPAWAAAAAPPEPTYSPQEEAAALLGLEVGASAYEVSERCQELTADLEQKLESARTPNLKATYQRNLDEIRRAAETLAPGLAGGGGVSEADLPSAQPSMVPDDLEDSILEPARAQAPAREAAAPPVSGPPMATTALGAVAALLLALAGFFSMSNSRKTKDLKALNKSAELTTARADWIKYEPIDQLEKSGALKNGALKLCNKASQPLDVSWLGAVYLDVPKDAAAGQGYNVKSYNSLFCRQEYKLSIPAGAEQAVSLASESDRCRWNGEGLFFALSVRRPPAAATAAAAGRAAPPPPAPEQLVHLSGLLNSRQDCVNIGEGW